MSPHSAEPTLVLEPKVEGKTRDYVLLRVVLWLVAIGLGAADAWASRSTMYPDGISYLDLGDSLWRGDWHHAINGYWSLAYPAILGFFLKVFKPSIRGEYPLVHLVNFLLYVLAMICFEVFLRNFICHQKRRNDSPNLRSEVSLPLWAWYVAGYAIFVSSSLFLITTSFVSGDMMIAGIIYLSFALILKIRNDKSCWQVYAILGVVLGIGYLTKTVMFLMAVPFIVVAALAATNRAKAVKFAAIACFSFLAITGPFILALSLKKQRPTFGDSGPINYVINVNRGQFYIPREADAKHPVNNLDATSGAYLYASPISGTYPLWYDPSYWHEGIHPYFNPKSQLRATALSLASCAWILFNAFLGLHITVLILLLYLITPLPITPLPMECLHRIKGYWYLWAPALAGIGLYCLVVVEYRYVGALFCVLWMVGLAGVRLPNISSSSKAIWAIVPLFAMATVALAVHQIFRETNGADFVERRIATPEIPDVATTLRSRGVKEGDKVALVCDWLFPSREGAYIARLLRVQIIGEVRPEQFWSASEPTRSKLIAAYANAGVRALLTYKPPRAQGDWERLGDSDYYLYLIREKSNGGKS